MRSDRVFGVSSLRFNGLSPSFLRTCALTDQGLDYLVRTLRVSVLLSLEHALWPSTDPLTGETKSCLSPSFLRTCALTPGYAYHSWNKVSVSVLLSLEHALWPFMWEPIVAAEFVSVLLSLEHALWPSRLKPRKLKIICLSPSFLRTCALTAARRSFVFLKKSQSFFP